MAQTRAEAKREYAMSILSNTKGKGVVVLPVFIEEVPGSGIWIPTDSVAIEGSNPEWCAVNVMSVQSSFNEQGFENERVMSALIRRKTVGTEDKYHAGQVLNGKIAIMETLTPTDSADESRDVKYPSASHQEAGIACTIAGQPIYQRKYYTEQLDKQDVTISHDNQEEIQQHRLAMKASGNTSGLQAAAANAKKKAELLAIPAAKRTPAQKKELLALA